MFTLRTEKSVALAKNMAEVLNVDLFDEHRRGNFRSIVQNCEACAHNSVCMQMVENATSLDSPLPQCLNRQIFTLGD